MTVPGYIFVLIWMLAGISPSAAKRVVVSGKGAGDFKTIQGAINSLALLPNECHEIIIKKGIYTEKLYIENSGISLIGEERHETIITNDIARDLWRCEHNDDWGVATINISGSDITLENLTVINAYGFNHKETVEVNCPKDSANPVKKVTPRGHQMALRSFGSTRLRAIGCTFKALGGDTVSPWNDSTGMYYFKDCHMEGAVDFYCPRGWALAENCSFYAHGGDAAVWHDGSKHESSKTIFKSCSFDGYKGFRLARYHRDAQFYFLYCSFSDNMADKAVFRVPTSNTIKWGHRVYFFNCSRPTGNFGWFTNNLEQAKGQPDVGSINAAWAFDGKWNPEKM